MPLPPTDLLIALAILVMIWLLTGLFRRHRLPRLLGWLTLGWALWHLRPGRRPPTPHATLGLALVGVLAAWLATRPRRHRRAMFRRG